MATARDMAPRPRKTGRRERMSGLAKGLAIVEAFKGKPELTISEAAVASDTTRAAARRCLLTLTELGYVESQGKLFRPSPRLLELGGISRMPSLPQAAQPILERLRDAMQESVSLAILEGDDALFVARAEAIRIVSTGVRIGASLPAFISATGRVLLAALPDTELAKRLAAMKVARRTPNTVVTASRLKKMIAETRTRGYAMSDEELELGLRALAVPVADQAGKTIASISVSASAARVSAAYMISEFFPLLRRNAEILGRVL